MDILQRAGEAVCLSSTTSITSYFFMDLQHLNGTRFLTAFFEDDIIVVL